MTALSPGTEDDVFSFFVSFSDRDLCTKRELRIKDLQRTQQNKRLTNPNLSAKVHEEAKQRGKKMTRSNIQNTKKKSYLKVALSFCCKRGGKLCYVMIIMMMMCLFFSFLFFSSFS